MGAIGVSGMRRRLSTAYALALLFCSSVHAGEVPQTIYDSGETLPIARYYEHLAPADGTPPPAPPVSLMNDLLPIRTPELSPGDVAARPLQRPALTRPLFLIGSDARSLAWLTRHRARLLSLQAVGMLVQAENRDDLARVARAASGVPIMPAPATTVAHAFGLTHYPVLISRTGIEQ